jgi:hypothetical protein
MALERSVASASAIRLSTRLKSRVPRMVRSSVAIDRYCCRNSWFQRLIALLIALNSMFGSEQGSTRA